MDGYELHFGLTESIFPDGLAQGDGVFKRGAIDELADDLANALSRKDSVAILSGVSGTGKSTLATDALKALDTRLAFSCIGHTPLTSQELLEQLLIDFGLETHDKSHVERLQEWRLFIAEMSATDTRVCLLVENAEELATDILVFLHRLTAADASSSPGVNVILTTAQAPERLLADEAMLALNQRVRLRRKIEPLSAEETRGYLDFKFDQAGVAIGAICDTDLAPRLFQLSNGIIRVINNLLECALVAAAAANETKLSIARLNHVARDQFGISELAPTEIDHLLEASAERIPTLTDFVDVEAEFAAAEQIVLSSTQH